MIAVATLKAPLISRVLEFVRICHEDVKKLDPWLYKYHRYLTIQSDVVKKGQAQRAPYWHSDNPSEDMPVYMCVEGQPTEFKGRKSKQLVIYRCGKSDLHRSPKVTKTHRRTFLRLAYSRREFSYSGETADLNLMVLG